MLGQTKVAAAVAIWAVFCGVSCDNSSPTNAAASGFTDTAAIGDSAAASDTGSSGADTVAADSGGTTTGGCTAASKPGPFHGSCNMAKIGLCQELTGSVYADPKVAEPACTKANGVFSATENCKADGRIGRCLNACGSPGELYLHYYVLDEATWKPKCEQDGKGLWTAK